MRDVSFLHPHLVTRLFPPLLATTGGLCSLACAVVAFGGGTLPFFGVEVDGGLGTGLLWLLVIGPALTLAVYLLSLHILIGLELLAATWTGSLRRSRGRRFRDRGPVRALARVADVVREAVWRSVTAVWSVLRGVSRVEGGEPGKAGAETDQPGPSRSALQPTEEPLPGRRHLTVTDDTWRRLASAEQDLDALERGVAEMMKALGTRDASTSPSPEERGHRAQRTDLGGI